MHDAMVKFHNSENESNTENDNLMNINMNFSSYTTDDKWTLNEHTNNKSEYISLSLSKDLLEELLFWQ